MRFLFFLVATLGVHWGLDSGGDQIDAFVWDSPKAQSVDASFPSCANDPEGEECWSDMQVAFRRALRLLTPLNSNPSILSLIESYVPYMNASLGQLAFKNTGSFMADSANLLLELMEKTNDPSYLAMRSYDGLNDSLKAGPRPDFMSVRHHLFYPDSDSTYVADWVHMKKQNDLSQVNETMAGFLTSLLLEVEQTNSKKLGDLTSLTNSLAERWQNVSELSSLGDSAAFEANELATKNVADAGSSLEAALRNLTETILPAATSNFTDIAARVRTGIDEATEAGDQLNAAFKNMSSAAMAIADDKYSAVLKFFDNRTARTEMFVKNTEARAINDQLLEEFHVYNESMISAVRQLEAEAQKERLDMEVKIEELFPPLVSMIERADSHTRAIAANETLFFSQEYAAFVTNLTSERDDIAKTLGDLKVIEDVLVDLQMSNENLQDAQTGLMVPKLPLMFEFVHNALKNKVDVLAKYTSEGLTEQVDEIDSFIQQVGSRMRNVSSRALSGSAAQLNTSGDSMTHVSEMLSLFTASVQNNSDFRQAQPSMWKDAAQGVLSVVSFMASAAISDLKTVLEEISSTNRKNALSASATGQIRLSEADSESAFNVDIVGRAIAEFVKDAEHQETQVIQQMNNNSQLAARAAADLTNVVASLSQSADEVLQRSIAIILGHDLENLHQMARQVTSQLTVPAVVNTNAVAINAMLSSFADANTALKTAITTETDRVKAILASTSSKRSQVAASMTQDFDRLDHKLAETLETSHTLLTQDFGLSRIQPVNFTSLVFDASTNVSSVALTFRERAAKLIADSVIRQQNDLNTQASATEKLINDSLLSAIISNSELATSVGDILSDTVDLNKTTTDSVTFVQDITGGGQFVASSESLRSDIVSVSKAFQESFPDSASPDAELQSQAVADLSRAISRAEADAERLIGSETLKATSTAIPQLDQLLYSLNAMNEMIVATNEGVVSNSSRWSYGRQRETTAIAEDIKLQREYQLQNITTADLAATQSKRVLLGATESIAAALGLFLQRTKPDMRFDQLKLLGMATSEVASTMDVSIEAAQKSLVDNGNGEIRGINNKAQEDVNQAASQVLTMGNRMLLLLNDTSGLSAGADSATSSLNDATGEFAADSKTYLADLLSKLKAGEISLDDEKSKALETTSSMPEIFQLTDALIDQVGLFRLETGKHKDEASLVLNDFSNSSSSDINSIRETIAQVKTSFEATFNVSEDRPKLLSTTRDALRTVMTAEAEQLKALQTDEQDYLVNTMGAAEKIIGDLKKNLTSMDNAQRSSVNEIVSDVTARITQRLRRRLGYRVELQTAGNLWSGDGV